MTHKRRIVAATSNHGKLAELSVLLAPHGIEIVAQSVLGCSEVEETGTTFVENALLKARSACAHTGLPTIADDSGLEVDALFGAPGIRSARYAGERASITDNICKLIGEMQSVEPDQRTARFRCVLVYMQHPTEPAPRITIGTWEGKISKKPCGEHGFGYDSIFFIEKLGKTAAQIDVTLKNKLSHRAQALRQFGACF